MYKYLYGSLLIAGVIGLGAVTADAKPSRDAICSTCTIVDGLSNPDRRQRPANAKSERRHRGDKNRGDGNGKPREYRDRRH